MKKGTLLKGILLGGLALFVVGISLNLLQVFVFSAHAKWSLQTGTIVFSPVVANGVVYAASTDGKLHAVDTTSGQEEWSFQAGSYTYYSTPAVANGRVYVAADGNGGNLDTLDAASKISALNAVAQLYALNAATGSVDWSFQLGFTRYTAPVIANDMVYMAAGPGPGNIRKLYALDAQSGNVKWIWSYQGGNAIESIPTVANGTVYVSAGDGKLHALNALSGQELWSFPGGSFNSAPPVANGIVYINNFGDEIYALDAYSGRKIWSYTTSVSEGDMMVVANNVLYVSTTNDHIYALDASSGREKWSIQLGGNNYYAAPVVVNNMVYVLPEGSIDALDAHSGHIKWSYLIGEIQTTPAIANNVVYAGGFDGKLYAIQAPLFTA